MAKFPDLSGDGKTTQKDILIGRGVIEKPKVKKMRLGGQSVEDTTKSIDLPMPKPFTNPVKTAINKIPEKLSNIGKGISNIDSAISRGLSAKIGKTKNMEKAQTPDKFKKKIAMRKIKNVAKDVFNRD